MRLHYCRVAVLDVALIDTRQAVVYVRGHFSALGVSPPSRGHNLNILIDDASFCGDSLLLTIVVCLIR